MLHFALVSLLLTQAAAAAAPAGKVSVRDVFDSQRSLVHFHDTAIAPDGSRTAWTVRVADAEGREMLGAVFVAQTEGRKAAAPDGGPRRQGPPRDRARLLARRQDDRLSLRCRDTRTAPDLDRPRRRRLAAAADARQGPARPSPLVARRPRRRLPLRRGLGAGDRRARPHTSPTPASSRRPSRNSASRSRTRRPAGSAPSRPRTSSSTTTTGRPTAARSRRRPRRGRAPTTTGSPSSTASTRLRARRARSGSRRSRSRARASRRTAARSRSFTAS